MNKEINLFYNNDNQYKGQIDTKMSTKHYTEFYSLSNSNTTERNGNIELVCSNE
jgi:hypothetical protein